MPQEYEAIRDSLSERGYDTKRAKGLAARIYNKRHGKGHGLRPDKSKKGKPIMSKKQGHKEEDCY